MCCQLYALCSGQAEEGQSLVEMAVVLPVFLLIITGIFSFGLTFNNYILLNEAVGTGGRQLAISRQLNTDPCAAAVAAVYAGAPTLSSGKMNFAFNINGNTYSGISCPSGSTSTGAAGNMAQNKPATVTVTYPCSLKVFGSDLVPNCILTARVTEATQ